MCAPPPYLTRFRTVYRLDVTLPIMNADMLAAVEQIITDKKVQVLYTHHAETLLPVGMNNIAKLNAVVHMPLRASGNNGMVILQTAEVNHAILNLPFVGSMLTTGSMFSLHGVYGAPVRTHGRSQPASLSAACMENGRANRFWDWVRDNKKLQRLGVIEKGNWNILPQANDLVGDRALQRLFVTQRFPSTNADKNGNLFEQDLTFAYLPRAEVVGLLVNEYGTDLEREKEHMCEVLDKAQKEAYIVLDVWQRPPDGDPYNNFRAFHAFLTNLSPKIPVTFVITMYTEFYRHELQTGSDLTRAITTSAETKQAVLLQPNVKTGDLRTRRRASP